MRAGLCCASETMGADGWPAADVAKPVTDACERVHPPMESISAAWQGLTPTASPDLDTETERHTLGAKTAYIHEQMQMRFRKSEQIKVCFLKYGCFSLSL